MRSPFAVGSGMLAALVLLLPAVLLGTVALAACGGSDTDGDSAATATTAPPSASPQTLPVAVEEFRGMLPVVTTSTLVKERPYGTEKTVQRAVGDVVQMRHAVWTYRQKSSDRRLNGIYDVVINVDQRQSDMSATLWGTSVLRNRGGAWVGKWTGGIAAGGDEHHMYWTMKGTGDYAGLVYHGNGWFVEAGAGFTPDIQIVYAGWIETKDGSPVPMSPGPGSTPENWTPVVIRATFAEVGYDTGLFTLDTEASDPRVSGRLEGTLVPCGGDWTYRADGSVDYTGERTLTNESGTWGCPDMKGVRGPGTVEHFQYWLYSGSGAYADLAFHYLSHFMERQDYVTGDTLVDTGWIEEHN